MRNPGAWHIAGVVWLAIGAGACSRGEKPREIAALDKADQAGVVTKDEYQQRRARPAAAAAAPANAAQGHVYRMRMVSAVDQHGFERPLVSASMLVPTDWQSQGSTTWNIMDRCNAEQTTLRASGPDGRAIEIFPTYKWAWADNPMPLRQYAAQQARFGSHACDVMPPMAAADYLRSTVGRIRPNAQLVGIEPAPKLMAKIEPSARESERMAMRYGLQKSIRPDVVRGRVKYNLNNQPVEEWIYVIILTTATLGPSMNLQTMQMTQAYAYNCAAFVTAERTPQGQLDASEQFFELLTSTFRINPDWQNRVIQNALAVQQIELKGARDRSAIISKSANEIADMQRQGWENRQRSQDRIAESFSQSTRGVETFRNPATGETIDLSDQYGHAWVNNRGEYLLSDRPGFDPSVEFREEWKPLERVRR